MTRLSDTQVQERLIAFIGERFLAGDAHRELSADTPLLEWGILDSLKVTVLLNFVRQDLGTEIPMEMMSGRHFRSVRTISALVCDLAGSEPA